MDEFNKAIRIKLAEMESKNLAVVVLSGQVYGRPFKMIIEAKETNFIKVN